MSEPATQDDDDFDFPPLTLQDRINYILDDLDTAADELCFEDLERLCVAIRKKIDEIDPSIPF